jgi:hypothetical protein
MTSLFFVFRLALAWFLILFFLAVLGNGITGLSPHWTYGVAGMVLVGFCHHQRFLAPAPGPADRGHGGTPARSPIGSAGRSRFRSKQASRSTCSTRRFAKLRRQPN